MSKAPNGAELIVNSSERIDAYDPRNGTPLWHLGDANRFPVPSPVVHDGVIYASRGYRSGPYMAIKPGGRGDVTSTHVVWSVATGAPYCSSLLYYDGIVYMANDVGVLTAVDAANGQRVWQERVDGVFSASPVGGGGHVYFVSEDGNTVVLKAAARRRSSPATTSASACWRPRQSPAAGCSCAPTSISSPSAALLLQRIDDLQSHRLGILGT